VFIELSISQFLNLETFLRVLRNLVDEMYQNTKSDGIPIYSNVGIIGNKGRMV